MITYTFTRQDQSGENTSTVFNTPYLFDDTSNETIIDAELDLRAALDAIAAAPTYRSIFTIVANRQQPQRVGHRELKWLLRFSDEAGRVYTHEVGTANPSLPRVHAGGKTLLSPNWTGYSQMKNRLERHISGPYGQALTLVEVEEVGRNI